LNSNPVPLEKQNNKKTLGGGGRGVLSAGNTREWMDWEYVLSTGEQRLCGWGGGAAQRFWESWR
jgi:hypothetical protein